MPDKICHSKILKLLHEQLLEAGYELSKGDVKTIMDTYFDLVENVFVENEQPVIVGTLGTLTSIMAKERNFLPPTGIEVTVPAHKVAKFRVNNRIKRLIRG
jgi:nucleoid DNA-binding protein